jgi:hypothetical protein
LELELPATARQGILGRLDIDSWRSSSKIEALVEELSNLRNQDATTKSIVFSQFVNFLDLIAFRLQRAGFSVNRFLSSVRTSTHGGFSDLPTRGYDEPPGPGRHYPVLQ